MRGRWQCAAWLWAPCIIVLVCTVSVGKEDLHARAERAKQEMIEGRFEAAVQTYSSLVRELPGNPGMLLNLGIAQQSAGRYRDAIASLSEALRLDPDLTPAKLMMGIAYKKLGEPAKAVRPLSAAVTAEPRNRIARWELADTLLATSRFEHAAQQFQRLTELDPRDARYWEGLGFSYLGLAHRSFAALEKAAPDSPYVYALLARSQKERRQDRSAFALYRKALKKYPDFPGIHAALAEIYRRNGHTDWAAVEERREQALSPADCSSATTECAFVKGQYAQVLQAADTPENLYWKNRSYSKMARDALAHLEQLPPSPQLYELMADALRLQGEDAEAAEALRNALKLDPASVHLRELLASELWRGRDWAAARPFLEEALAADPNSAELNYELGDLFLEQQEARRALPLLEKAVGLKPDLLEAQDSLGRVLVDCGRAQDAILHFQAALPLDQDGNIHFQLSHAAKIAGNPALAKEAFREFQIMSQASAARVKLFEKREITAPN